MNRFETGTWKRHYRDRDEHTEREEALCRKNFVTALVFLVCLLISGTAATEESVHSAKELVSARTVAERRLDSALRNLFDERTRIAKEKIPLSAKVSRLESDVARLRQERNRLLKVRDAGTIDLGSLRKQVAALAEQEEFVKSRLNEFVRDFEGRLDISELSRYEERTSRAKLADKNVTLDREKKRAAKVAVVEVALDRLQEQLGGSVFRGEALSPDGVLTEGAFIRFGPTVFFSSKDDSVRGLVESRVNAADPVVVALPKDMTASFGEIVQGGTGELPFDPTLGRALKIEKARKTMGEYIAEGGVVGYVILALGMAALALTAFKAFEILGFRVAPFEAVHEILEDLEAGSPEAASKRAELVTGVAGEMLSTGVRHATESRSVLEELLFEKVLRARPTLERFLPFLAITAAAAPLLGLLGTVIGMINTFQLITIFGSGDAKSLSSGISEALMTTALGLIVAIPTLILHGALTRMAKRKLGLLEELSVAFVNGIEVLRSGNGRL